MTLDRIATRADSDLDRLILGLTTSTPAAGLRRTTAAATRLTSATARTTTRAGSGTTPAAATAATGATGATSAGSTSATGTTAATTPTTPARVTASGIASARVAPTGVAATIACVVATVAHGQIIAGPARVQRAAIAEVSAE
ncbi:MAG: hypothetical protein ABI200_03000 [Gaiellales bacterium]